MDNYSQYFEYVTFSRLTTVPGGGKVERINKFTLTERRKSVCICSANALVDGLDFTSLLCCVFC